MNFPWNLYGLISLLHRAFLNKHMRPFQCRLSKPFSGGPPAPERVPISIGSAQDLEGVNLHIEDPISMRGSIFKVILFLFGGVWLTGGQNSSRETFSRLFGVSGFRVLQMIGEISKLMTKDSWKHSQLDALPVLFERWKFVTKIHANLVFKRASRFWGVSGHLALQ